MACVQWVGYATTIRRTQRPKRHVVMHRLEHPRRQGTFGAGNMGKNGKCFYRKDLSAFTERTGATAESSARSSCRNMDYRVECSNWGVLVYSSLPML